MKVFVASAAAVLTDHAGHGEGLIAWNVCRGLGLRGHEVVACAPTVDVHAEPPFRILELGRPRLESLHPYVYAARARRALASEPGVDVVHWIYPGEPDQALFAPPDGTPFVLGPLPAPWPTRERSTRPGDLVRTALSPFERRLHRRALAQATVLLATPDARASGRVVSPGVDVDRFVVEPAHGTTIAFVGRLERAKGVRELAEAFTIVRRSHPDARLVLAGDGSERAWLSGRDGVEVRGHIPPDEIPSFLRGASLVAAPSHREPYGMTIAEAMAAGRAVVATDDGGPRYLVPPAAGTLVPVGDTAALAGAIVELLSDQERLAAMGRAAREHAERELSLDHMLDELEAVYAEAAA